MTKIVSMSENHVDTQNVCDKLPRIISPLSLPPPTSGGPDELGERLQAPRSLPERRRLSSNRLEAHL